MPPAAGALTPEEKHVDGYKAWCRKRVQRDRGAVMIATVGDQMWDLASWKVWQSVDPELVAQLENGRHHLLSFGGHYVGLKLDMASLRGGPLRQAVTATRHQIIKHGVRAAKAGASKLLVVFDVDATLIEDDEEEEDEDVTPRKVTPVVDLLHEIQKDKTLGRLAKRWKSTGGPSTQQAAVEVRAHIITARMWDSGAEADLRELLRRAGIDVRGVPIEMRPDPERSPG
jgi:hypothetical protein